MKNTEQLIMLFRKYLQDKVLSEELMFRNNELKVNTNEILKKYDEFFNISLKRFGDE